MNICPKLHFPENLFARIYTCQNVLLAEITFLRKLTFQDLHLPECTFGRNYISPKTYFPDVIGYTLNRNFVIGRIYITKIYNYACPFSKIIKLGVE